MAAFSGKLTSRPPLWTSPLKIPQHDSVQSLIFHSELLFFRVNDLERDFSRLFKWFWPLSVCSCRDDYFSISAIALVFFLQPIHRMETVQRFFSFFIQTPPPPIATGLYTGWLTAFDDINATHVHLPLDMEEQLLMKSLHGSGLSRDYSWRRMQSHMTCTLVLQTWERIIIHTL